MSEAPHRCSEQLPQDGSGPAIDSCDEDARGVLWAGNSEYATAVRFCPFCGFRAPMDPATLPRSTRWAEPPRSSTISEKS